MKFLHTSDWQIGMKADSVGLVAERVREERLAAANRVVQAARDQGAEMILLTGDVFEDNAVDRILVRKVGEILRSFVHPVYIIPGNHDPLVPGSVWEHAVWHEATNITVFHKPEPVELESCVMFPCPLKEKYSTKDPTAWIDATQTEKIAIGLAHGTVEGVGNCERDYPIPRDVPARHGLDFLALGHWHSFARFEEKNGICRMAYAGTHETTRFGERDSGYAVTVEIAQRGSVPKIIPVRTGRLVWSSMERLVDQPQSMEPLMQELTTLNQPELTLLRLNLHGVLFPEDRGILKHVEELIASRFLYGAIDTTRLIPAPDGEGWIENLPPGHFREAATKLRCSATRSPNPEERSMATQALLQLFELQERARV